MDLPSRGRSRMWFCVIVLLVGCQSRPQPVEAAQQPEKKEIKQEVTMKKGEVFEPQVANAFYPGDPVELRQMIQKYLDGAKASSGKVPGDLLGILVPHAGYPYSGPVAAHAFRVAGEHKVKRVVLLGPAHRCGFSTPAILDQDAYRTPLGDIPIDRTGVKKLADTGTVQIDKGKFLGEHALEVELPFLQVALGSFELVPLMISEPDPEGAAALARALKQTFPGRDTLFVASSDMSHDYPYDVATALDENALRYVQALDVSGLHRAYVAHHQAGMAIKVKNGKPEPDCQQLCGMGPVMTLMELAKLFGDTQATVLDRRNSGDVIGDKSSRIVGYSAVAFGLKTPRPEGQAVDAKAAAANPSPKEEDGDFLSADEKKTLLKLARDSLAAYLKDRTVIDFTPKTPALSKPGAAFVTLKKAEDLRGCIGHMEPSDPLWKMIRDRAIDAAVHDPRFEPVTERELKDLEIEISVLSPRLPVKNPLTEIQIGRDGVWLELGMHRGVFLPQVPVEQGWKTVEEYLDNLCRKAHLFERGCWRSAEARLMRFTALVFGE